ncbi:MAG: polyprenyl synthetase family protein [Clostridiales bacterium]|nr:polyprenyl synthetase family protein [Clostridiales bacterium]
MYPRYNEYKAMIENYLGSCFDDRAVSHAELLQAMRYSLLAGGKRVRPVLVLEFCAAAGGCSETALPVACAVEMLHTYSLIHDDLPCMDNDDMRRGKPTNHKIYGETTAVLAGDALQAEAFKTILSSKLPADIRAECARILADAAGENGICGGQYLDMKGESEYLKVDELFEMCRRKTASLISAACKIGAVIGRADEKQLEAAESYGNFVGLAFQIRDDIIDVLSTSEELGKPAGSDAREGKSTFMSLLGLEKCEEYLTELTEKAKEVVLCTYPAPKFLVEFAEELRIRRS